MKSGRQSIRLECPNVSLLEDSLNQQPLPVVSCLIEEPGKSEDETISASDYQEILSDDSGRLDDSSAPLSSQTGRYLKLDNSHAWSRLSSKELLKSLTQLYRQSRLDLDEGGVNTLFLAIGILEWSDNNKDRASFLLQKSLKKGREPLAESSMTMPQVEPLTDNLESGSNSPQVPNETLDCNPNSDQKKAGENSELDSQTRQNHDTTPVVEPKGDEKSPVKNKRFLAPILLIPVQLQRQAGKVSYKITRRDEDTIINATLLEMLRRDYGITFPEYSSELPSDDYGVDVPAVLKLVSERLEEVPGWSVHADAWLSRFSFNKYIMYTDLNDRWELLTRNPVVKRLIETSALPADASKNAEAEPGTSESESALDSDASISGNAKASEIIQAKTGLFGADSRSESGSAPQLGSETKSEAEIQESTVDAIVIEGTPDSDVSYDKLFLPVSADASQTQAVLQSQTGQSFVLYGPPGTGKSQTITNLIAHNLAMGRRTLFVSEKRAALEVVYNRLSKIGLAPFCLELHSNKAGKKETLEQFNETLSLAGAHNSWDNWRKTCSQLNETQDQLNHFIDLLHRPHANGLSAYDCIGWILSSSQSADKRLPLRITPFGPSLDFGRQSLADCRRMIERIQEHAADLPPDFLVSMSPLQDWTWSPANETALVESAQKLGDAMNTLITLTRKIIKSIHFIAQRGTPNQAGAPNTPQPEEPVSIVFTYLKLIPRLLDFLSDPAKSALPVLGSTIIKDFLSRKDDWQNKLDQFFEARKRLRDYDWNRILTADLNDLRKKIEYNNQRFILFRLIANHFLVKEWAFLKRPGSGAPLTITELAALIPDMTTVKTLLPEIKKEQKAMKTVFGSLWQGEDSDWDALKTRLEGTLELQQLWDILAPFPEEQKLFQTYCLNVFATSPSESPIETPSPKADGNKTGSGQNQVSNDRPAGTGFQARRPPIDRSSFDDASRRYQLALTQLNSQTPLVNPDYRRVFSFTAAVSNHSKSLRTFSFYLKLANEARKVGLGPFVNALQSGQITDSGNLATIFDLEARQQTLDEIMAKEPELTRFSGLNQDQTIETYRKLFDQYMEQTQRQIINLLYTQCAKVLAQAEVRGSSVKQELALLKKEIGKKMRQIPIRSLLERIPQLSAALKPCLLMSPLSVAQYLPAEHADFDLVVFDEASQITTWDAIGVIARGKQLIVVGDPQQMPPTNFFQKQQESSEFDEFDNPLDADLESILDECIAMNLPGCYLNTHYRSRHESLIAFSNHYYYRDRLATFPSAAQSNESLGIQFVYVPDGVYDRSKSRTNLAEARKLVDIVCQRLKKPETAKRSMGVVTFSLTQRELIEDLLEQARRDNPDLEYAMNEDNPEPLFVKNLESVQGDERDCMLFAIGYGPDDKGKITMNFGPLNKIGGHRRLNVAVTRAKYQIIVVSSMHSEQIDLNRTQAIGAAHLKYFLQYAESGTPSWSLPGREKKALAENRKAFSDAVAMFLEKQGFKVKQNLGLSNFTIDIAVAQPSNSQENIQYKWAIECDGPVYRDAPNARDRDTLRPSVLQGLGWNVIRLWSVEWYHNTEKAQQQLLNRLR